MLNLAKSAAARFVPPRLLFALMFACAPAFAFGEEAENGQPLVFEDVVEDAADYLEGVFSGDFQWFEQEDWDLFWEEVQNVLHSGSIDSLAVMQPVVDQGLVYMDAIPAWSSTADWFRQRVDYFDLAGDVVYRNYSPGFYRRSGLWTPPLELGGAGGTGAWKPARKPPAKTAPNTARKPGVIKAKRPAAANADARSRRSQIVRNQATWMERLAGRAAPERAAALVPMLKVVFKSEGVPPELVWIAEVESTMNPDAQSPAGAVGLFQLMPATAQRFGLRTGLVDDRRTPEKNARAAAQYLKILHKRFQSWPLALAAYNSGEGRVGSLLKRSKAASFDAIAEDLSVETRMYVPKVIALVKLREKVDVPNLPGPASGLPRFYACGGRALFPLFAVLSGPESFGPAW